MWKFLSRAANRAKDVQQSKARSGVGVTKEQVLDALRKVTSPRGVSLTDAGVLSDVVVADGKAFLLIAVDAAEAPAWEAVRKQADSAVRAIPGVVSAMVALTAERKAGAAPATSPATAPSSAPRAPLSPAPAARQGVARETAHKPPHNPHGSPMSRRARNSRRDLHYRGGRRARAVSENRPPRSIWRLRYVTSASRSACSMPTSMDRRCRA